MAKRKVLITGGTGYVAWRMLPVLRERYDLTVLDVKTTNREGEEVRDVVIADLTNRDQRCVSGIFQGAGCDYPLRICADKETMRIAFGQR